MLTFKKSCSLITPRVNIHQALSMHGSSSGTGKMLFAENSLNGDAARLFENSRNGGHRGRWAVKLAKTGSESCSTIVPQMGNNELGGGLGVFSALNSPDTTFAFMGPRQARVSSPKMFGHSGRPESVPPFSSHSRLTDQDMHTSPHH